MPEYQNPNPSDLGLCEHGNFKNECLICGQKNREKTASDKKTKKLFGHGFEITKIEEGDYIPVGGKSRFSDETDIKIEGDFSSFRTPTDYGYFERGFVRSEKEEAERKGPKSVEPNDEGG